MVEMPDSSDRMPTAADTIAEIKIKQAHHLLQEVMASPTFTELRNEHRVEVSKAFLSLDKVVP